jgi:hypothetical protein
LNEKAVASAGVTGITETRSRRPDARCGIEGRKSVRWADDEPDAVADGMMNARVVRGGLLKLVACFVMGNAATCSDSSSDDPQPSAVIALAFLINSFSLLGSTMLC